jgi:hypothetical protein
MRQRTYCAHGSNQPPQEQQQPPQEQQGKTPMTDILLENIKLVMLFVLIATVIGMSHFGLASPTRRKSHHRHSGAPAPAGR